MRSVSVGFKAPKQPTERRPEMGTIRVRVKEGRRAFYNRKELKHEWQSVNDDSDIARLRDHWGDIEQEGAAPPPEGGEGGGEIISRRRGPPRGPIHDAAKE